MIKITKIKKSLVQKLKYVRDIDVLFETVDKTTSEDSIQNLDSWFFVSLIPIGNTLFGKELRNRVILVDISYYFKNASKNDYFIWNDDMEENFMPTFPIEGRNITIEESTFKIVDDVAHFVFSLKFRDCIDLTPEAQQMSSSEESEISLNII